MNATLEQFLVHQRKCARCKSKLACSEGYRLFNDGAWIEARTPNKKRAKA